MADTPALAMRAALAEIAASAPQDCGEHRAPFARTAIAADYASRYAGVPATPFPRREPAVTYTNVEGAALPLVLGLYGCSERVRAWLPGLPRRTNAATATALAERAIAPKSTDGGRPSPWRRSVPVDLTALPAPKTTPHDAGAYLTMGVVCASSPAGDAKALSIHRMLILDERRLAIWMLPSRALRALAGAAAAAGRRLPVTVNIGAPPAVVLASALSTAWLPEGVGKLDLAGALANGAVALTPAVTQPASALATAEIVLEGYLDGASVDESLDDAPLNLSMPEFLGYDGRAQRDLPVVTITGVTVRERAVFQAVIGPGREQSTILGLAGALTVAMSLANGGRLAASCPEVRDLAFPSAGGGMLLLFVQVAKTAPDHEDLTPLALWLFERHTFIKLIVFVDEDVNVKAEEDVLWAMTTRANLGTDVTTLEGYPRLAMDPSQQAGWRANGAGSAQRSFVDATRPFALRAAAARSYAKAVEGVPSC